MGEQIEIYCSGGERAVLLRRVERSRDMDRVGSPLHLAAKDSKMRNDLSFNQTKGMFISHNNQDETEHNFDFKCEFT